MGEVLIQFLKHKGAVNNVSESESRGLEFESEKNDDNNFKLLLYLSSLVRLLTRADSGGVGK